MKSHVPLKKAASAIMNAENSSEAEEKEIHILLILHLNAKKE